MVLTHSQDEQYFTRMGNALGDKIKILNTMTTPGTVLDVGAGGGELAAALHLSGHTVTAIDASPTAIARIHQNYPHIQAIEAYVNQLHTLLPAHSFDYIICSSILHEVYSYGKAANDPGNLQDIYQAFATFHKLLKPGGKLIIRDGVMPNHPNKQTTLVFQNPEDGRKFIQYYQKHSPFWSDNPQHQHHIKLQEHTPGKWHGTLNSAMEILYTYTWGWNSAPREVKEFYGLMTETQYQETLTEIGFTVNHHQQYLQPGYPQHLNNIAWLETEPGNKSPYPSSNMLITCTT